MKLMTQGLSLALLGAGLAAVPGLTTVGAHAADEEHPVMASVGNTGVALHERGGPGFHAAVRVSEEEREEIKRRLDDEGKQQRSERRNDHDCRKARRSALS